MWLKSPTSNGKNYKENPASAVVNKDGTPKVVYHYTNGDFTVFNTDASGSNQGKTHGDGIYVSTNPTEFKYAGKNRMGLLLPRFTIRGKRKAARQSGNGRQKHEFAEVPLSRIYSHRNRMQSQAAPRRNGKTGEEYKTKYP